jgi:hypothetical protein
MTNFATVIVPHDQLALYQLTINSPDPPFLPVTTYTFPLSPQRIRKRFTALSQMYDTAGSPLTGGVLRTIDTYGVTPFFYEIEGTTGWNLHSNDGFIKTGMASIHILQDMFQEYAQLNQIQQLNNDPNMYTMEFADFFNAEFYQVEPMGPQEVLSSDRAPMLQYYRLRMAGVQPVFFPINADLVNDLIFQLLSIAAPVAVRKTLSVASKVLQFY